MVVTLSDVLDRLIEVLTGQLSRDEADRWAYVRMLARNDDKLIFSPPEAADRIWDGILFLYGIDLKLSPKADYLHDNREVQEILARLRGPVN